ncbi:MAG: hypothetical protein CMM01_22695 [Rhodopirellula sp.]|nr:hypothetical protein [Rhodopirellula sp.]
MNVSGEILMNVSGEPPDAGLSPQFRTPASAGSPQPLGCSNSVCKDRQWPFIIGVVRCDR